MAEQQITDPNNTSRGGASYAQTTEEYIADGAITAKNVVYMTTAFKAKKAATNTEQRLTFGIALGTAADGEIVSIVTRGLVQDVPADGVIADGDLLERGTTTAGGVVAVVSAATSIGDMVGRAVGAAANGVVDVYVQKL